MVSKKKGNEIRPSFQMQLRGEERLRFELDYRGTVNHVVDEVGPHHIRVILHVMGEILG